jgi:ferredoxin
MPGGGHVMDGIPTWMAIVGVVTIVVVSHIFVRRKHEASDSYWRYNLLKHRPLKALVQRSWFPLAIQSVSAFLILLVIGAGLFGSPRSNIAPVLTWTWWWVLLIFFILGFGKIFCSVCPWEAFSSMITSLSLRSRVKRLGFERKWPKWAQNIYPALGLFILLTWFELGFDVTRSPVMTAVMALAMVALAVLAALVFERRAFCRHACLVGRISGLYALFSPIELRPESADVCRDCESKACYHGGNGATGCPTGLFPGYLQENTYCTLCTECVRSCPVGNIAINLRPPATDLTRKHRFRWDEAVMAIVLLALTSFHGITMTPHWNTLNNQLRVSTGLGPNPIFTVLMAAMTLAPVLLFGLAAAWAARRSGLRSGKLFRAFAYAVIPVALFYHLAHNGMHFFMEAQVIIPLLSDPFGWGWDLFGTAGKQYPALLSLGAIWWLQWFLIIVGHIYGVIVAERITRRVAKDEVQARRAILPLIVVMVLYSAFSVWLIAQPMDMRTAM